MKKLVPENVMIYARENQHTLNKFIKEKFNFSRESLENDYTKFDQSQKAEFVHFQIQLLEYLNIPKYLIKMFVELKLGYHDDKSLIDFMILTGAFYTYIFNTLDNMAFAATKYSIPLDTPQCYSGDDSVINAPVQPTAYFQEIERYFRLESKPAYSKRPMFCGYYFTSHGIIKDPILVYFRLQLAKEQENLIDTIESIYFDHLFAYLLGDTLYDHIELEELEYHQANCRFFTQNKNINRYYHKQVTQLNRTLNNYIEKTSAICAVV